MTNIRKTLIALCAATASMGAFAQAAEEHQAHHPAGAASAAGPVKKAPVKAMGADKMAAMDQHMKTMQEGMTMMKQMGGKGMKGDMASRQQMMEKRMDMMESMMQMMMDRMPPAPAN